MSNTQTTSLTELQRNLWKESRKKHYKMGEWEDMEEDLAIMALEALTKLKREEGTLPPHQGV